MAYSSKSLFFKLAICLLLAIVSTTYLADSVNCHSHDHHGHSHDEPAHFKYSKEANQKQQQHHGHAHDHHGHAHNHHGHAHNHHGHAHDHHGHAHDHHRHVHDEPAHFKYSKEANQKNSDHHGHAHDHHQQKRETEEPIKHGQFTIVLNACLSTLLISLAPFVILFFIPLNNNGIENQSLLKILLGFASGSLLGDAFLHLIPHAMNPHDHHGDDHSHAHSHSDDAHDHTQSTIVGLSVLAGLLTFLLIEKLVKHLKGDDHSHTHSHSAPKKAKESGDEDSSSKQKGTKTPKKTDAKKKVEKENEGEINVAGYLNLAADFSHNFTDGLAIGASYIAGQNIGIITTLTILFHEIPHEIGDFAVLIQSGCSKKKAIYLQLFTALGALSGTLISLLFESAISGVANSFILPFTAGGFIYIATVSIIPELKESTGLCQSIKEIFALLVGIAMMVIIAYIE